MPSRFSPVLSHRNTATNRTRHVRLLEPKEIAMNRRIWMMLALSASLAATATAWGHEAAKKAAVQVVVELADGSRLVGTPLDQALHVKLDFMTADIPLAGIKQCEVRPKDERVTIHLKNGDRLTGTLEVHRFKLETVLGKLSAEFAQIDRLTFTTGEKESSPAEKGSIEFGGLNWLPWKRSEERRVGKEGCRRW